MTHDNTGAVIPKFRSIGARTSVRSAAAGVLPRSRCAERDRRRTCAKYARHRGVRARARHRLLPGEDRHRPPDDGRGGVRPARRASWSPPTRTATCTARLGALGTPIVRTDAAAIWATGETWWQVPDVVRVSLTGRLAPGATGKDVIISLIGLFNQDEVLNCCDRVRGRGRLAHASTSGSPSPT